jgi:DNA-binding response OmpR family regulator
MPKARKTLLLVDDEPMVRQVLGGVVILHGYNLLEAEDYYTALQVTETYDGGIDLLVTDIALPGLNGCELAAKLLQGHPALRVLFISGYTGSEICQYYGVQLDDLHFLAKPFMPGELLRRLETLSGSAVRYPPALRPAPMTFSAGDGQHGWP